MKKKKIKHYYPDARLKGVHEFLEIIRNEKEWTPEKIDIDLLKTLNIASGGETNLVKALLFLGIITKDGIPTDEFENIRSELKDNLARLVRSAYSNLFNTIPINRITQATLVSFFQVQGYAKDTSEYRAKLFVELCTISGISLPNVEKRFVRTHSKK